MSDSRWDKYKDDGKYVKFKALNDFVEGIVNDIKFETKFNKEQPVLYLRCKAIDAESGKEYLAERILTVGQTNLQRQLAEDPPEVGDGIKITFTHTEPSGNPEPTKIFMVERTPRAMVGKESPSPTGEPVAEEDEPF